MKKYIFLFLFQLMVVYGHGATDTFMKRNIYDIYRYCVTDYAYAQTLMNRIRQSKILPEYELNLIEGDVHFNRSEYFEAMRFYKRAQYHRVISDSVEWQKDLLMRLVPCCQAIGDIRCAEQYAACLEMLAAQTKDMRKQAIARFFQGRCAYGRGYKSKAYRLMYMAVDQLKAARPSDDELFRHYMYLVEYLQDDNKDKEALDMLARAAELAGIGKDVRRRENAKLPEQSIKDIYAHLAVLTYRKGLTVKAKEYYHIFKVLGNSRQYNYKCVIPYLKANSLYGDMIEFGRSRIDYLQKVSVTGTAAMPHALHMLADGYNGMEDYRAAVASYKRLASLKRDIIDKAEMNAMEELSSVYEQKKLEMQQQKQEEKKRLVKIVSLVVVAAVIVHACCIFVLKRQAGHRDDLKNVRKYGVVARTASIKMAHSFEEDGASDDQDRLLFESIKTELVARKLYLQPELNRDKLLQLFHIPKNKFSSLFTKFAGMSYSQFINELRMEHAVAVLTEHPNYTIDAIAKECGMTATTFYRLFSQRYGMTPTEFRESGACSPHEKA